MPRYAPSLHLARRSCPLGLSGMVRPSAPNCGPLEGLSITARLGPPTCRAAGRQGACHVRRARYRKREHQSREKHGRSVAFSFPDRSDSEAYYPPGRCPSQPGRYRDNKSHQGLRCTWCATAANWHVLREPVHVLNTQQWSLPCVYLASLPHARTLAILYARCFVLPSGQLNRKAPFDARSSPRPIHPSGL